MADTNKIARQEDLQIIADEVIGHADISQIGDGTTRGGVLYLNTNKLDNKTTESNKGKTVVVDDSGNLGFSSIESYGSTQTQTQKTVLDGVEGNPNVEGTIAKKLVDVKEHLGEVDISSVGDSVTDSISNLNTSLGGVSEQLEELGYGEYSGSGNIWDEQWEVGSINTSTGEKQEATGRIRSENFIHVKPSTTYYMLNPNNVKTYYYDSSKAFISVIDSSFKNSTFTTPSNCYYVMFATTVEQTTYNNDVAIIEGTSGEYKPYIKSAKQLTDEVRGINSSLGNVTNMLKPTLQSQVLNGVTCTKLDNGCYSFSGTASAKAVFVLQSNIYLKAGTYKYLSCEKKVDGVANYFALGSEKVYFVDEGNGKIETFSSDVTLTACRVAFQQNITVNNYVVKPMLCTNLNAQYSDFVAYTGSTGKLNSDVAESARTEHHIIGSGESFNSTNFDNISSRSRYGYYNGLRYVNINIYLKKAMQEEITIAILPSEYIGTDIIQINSITERGIIYVVWINTLGELKIKFYSQASQGDRVVIQLLIN